MVTFWTKAAFATTSDAVSLVFPGWKCAKTWILADPTKFRGAEFGISDLRCRPSSPDAEQTERNANCSKPALSCKAKQREIGAHTCETLFSNAESARGHRAQRPQRELENRYSRRVVLVLQH